MFVLLLRGATLSLKRKGHKMFSPVISGNRLLLAGRGLRTENRGTPSSGCSLARSFTGHVPTIEGTIVDPSVTE